MATNDYPMIPLDIFGDNTLNNTDIQEQPDSVSLFATDNRFGDYPMEEDVAQTKTSKLLLSLQEGDNIDSRRIMDAFTSGDQSGIRQSLSASEELRLKQAKVDILGALAHSRENGYVSPEEHDLIMNLSQEEITNPDTIIERKFARKVVNSFLASDGGDLWSNASQQDAATVDEMTSKTEDIILKNQVADDAVEKYEQMAKKQGWLPWAGDVAKTLVPGYSLWKQYKTLPDVNSIDNILPGKNMQEKVMYLWSLPPSQMKETLENTLSAIAQDNIPLAADFARYFRQFTSEDAFVTNAMGALDAAGVGELTISAGKGLGKAGARLIGRAGASKAERAAVEDLSRGLNDIAKTATTKGATVADHVAATGAVDQSAIVKAAKIAQEIGASTKGDAKGFAKFLEEKVPSLFNPGTVIPNNTPGRLGSALANDIVHTLNENAIKAVQALDTPLINRVDSGSPAQVQMVTNAIESVKADLGKKASGGIIDYTHVEAADTFSNAGFIDVNLGRKDKSLFDTVPELENYIRKVYKLDPAGVDINQVGNKFVATIRKNLDEYDGSVKDLLLQTETEVPTSITNMFLGRIRSADANVSESANAVRKQVTYLHGSIEKAVNDMAAPIGRLNSKQYKRLEAVLEENALYSKNGVEGRYFDNVNDYVSYYSQAFNDIPSPKEIKAYFTARQLNDLDYVARNLQDFRYKAVRGVEDHFITIPLTDPSSGKLIQNTTTKAIQGKTLRDGIPFSDGNPGRVLVFEKDGTWKVYDKERMTAVEKENLKKSLKTNNSKTIQLFDPNRKEINKYIPGYMDPDPIHFVVAPNVKSQALDFQQVPYRAGGHRAHTPGQTYVAQPMIHGTKKGKQYEGDFKFSSHVTEAEAQAWAKNMEEGRQLLKTQGRKLTNAQLDQFLQSRGTPFSAKTFRAQFGKDKLSVDNPIVVLKDGQRYSDIADLKAQNVRDTVNSPYNMAAERDTRFLSERNGKIQSFGMDTSGAAPVWANQQIKYMSPLSTINGALSDVLQSRLYSSYIDKSANEFVEQFGDLLVGGKTRARQAPVYHLLNPEWVSGRATGKSDLRISAAKRAQTALRNLIGTPSTMQAKMNSVKNEIANFLWEKGHTNAADWINESNLFKARDPFAVLRAYAFHSKIGMFNPVQIVLNAQTLAHMSAISPRHALGAFKDGMLMKVLEYNQDPALIAHLAKKSGNPKYFVEMYNGMLDSGVLNVNGAVAHLDDVLSPKTIKGKFGTFLDYGTVFFKSSEKLLRQSAYIIAHREWREANPTAIFNDAARRSIITRMDNLNANMTRASNGLWQRGILSVPTQFTSYQLRVSEQILEGLLSGKGALTRAEAARVVGMYSLMYGIPSATGAAVGIWPVMDSFKFWAEKNGVDTESNFFTRTLAHGLVNSIHNYFTGEEWNFAERWGPGGISFIRDAINGDKSSLELFLGPSDSLFSDVARTSSPFLHRLGSMFSDDPNSEFRLTNDHFISAARSISSLDNATKAYMASRYGLWLSKNDVVQTDNVGGFSAFVAALGGLSPQEVADLYIKKQVLGDYAKQKDALIKEASKEVQRAVRAMSMGNDAGYETMMRNVQAIIFSADIAPMDRAEVMSKIMKAAGPEAETIDVKLLQKSLTTEEYNSRLDQIKRKENNQNGAQ